MIALLIPLGLLLGIDLYFFQIIKTLLADSSERLRFTIYVLYWIVSILMIVSVFLSADRSFFPVHVRYYVFSLLLLLLVPKVLGLLFLIGEDIFRLGEKISAVISGSDDTTIHGRRQFISRAGIIAASLPFATMLYGMVKTGFDIRVRKLKASFEDLPSEFEGLKIVQISDLHSGSFTTESHFEEAVNRINALNPDLVFFTGDLVNNEAVEAERFVETFSKLKAKLGVYSILGNHDYGDYGPWPSKEEKANNLKRLKQVHHDAGWNLLLNDSSTINMGESKLAIVGVENWGAARHFPKYGDLDKAVEKVKDIPFKILLSHDPSHWDAKVQEHEQKFHLTLSGHTHGAQFGIEIPGFKWSPVQYVYKQWAGLYEGVDGQKLYVNRGLGFIGYMGRIGIPPEITFLELNSSKNA